MSTMTPNLISFWSDDASCDPENAQVKFADGMARQGFFVCHIKVGRERTQEPMKQKTGVYTYSISPGKGLSETIDRLSLMFDHLTFSHQTTYRTMYYTDRKSDSKTQAVADTLLAASARIAVVGTYRSGVDVPQGMRDKSIFVLQTQRPGVLSVNPQTSEVSFICKRKQSDYERPATYVLSATIPVAATYYADIDPEFFANSVLAKDGRSPHLIGRWEQWKARQVLKRSSEAQYLSNIFLGPALSSSLAIPVGVTIGGGAGWIAGLTAGAVGIYTFIHQSNVDRVLTKRKKITKKTMKHADALFLTDGSKSAQKIESKPVRAVPFCATEKRFMNFVVDKYEKIRNEWTADEMASLADAPVGLDEKDGDTSRTANSTMVSAYGHATRMYHVWQAGDNLDSRIDFAEAVDALENAYKDQQVAHGLEKVTLYKVASYSEKDID